MQDKISKMLKSYNVKYIFFVLWTIIWLVMAFQYNSKPLSPFDDVLEQQRDLEKILSLLEIEKNEYEAKIIWYEKLLSEQSKVSWMPSDYEELRNEAWLTEITWEWIEMSISWDISWSDLRDIVNVLRWSYAKAISIWRERILYNTSIIDLKDAILVGNIRMKPPINIKVIWEADIIKSQMTLNEGLKWLLAKIKLGSVKVAVDQKMLSISAK